MKRFLVVIIFMTNWCISQSQNEIYVFDRGELEVKKNTFNFSYYLESQNEFTEDTVFGEVEKIKGGFCFNYYRLLKDSNDFFTRIIHHDNIISNDSLKVSINQSDGNSYPKISLSVFSPERDSCLVSEVDLDNKGEVFLSKTGLDKFKYYFLVISFKNSNEDVVCKSELTVFPKTTYLELVSSLPYFSLTYKKRKNKIVAQGDKEKIIWGYLGVMK